MLKADLFLFEKINQFVGRFSWLDKLAIFFARYFEFFLILIFLFFLALEQYRQFAVEALIAAVFSRFVIVVLIQWFWQRPRPYVERSVKMLFKYNPMTPASFPSGHAAFYFALAAVVYFYNKEMGAVFLGGALFIALARVFAGLHWPTDVIAGALIGILSALTITLFVPRFF